LRYEPEHPPEVHQDGASLRVRTKDLSLQKPVDLPIDLLVLSVPIIPSPQTRHLAAMFKTPLDANGFLLEAHVKLRPVDSSTEGVFLAGSAHYPKLLDETLIQAQAAASRAARILSRKSLSAGGRVAVVDAQKCTGCLTCVRICPFQVPRIDPSLQGVGNIQGAAYIEAAICQGCGSCAAECPARAIQLLHYTDAQMGAKIDALFVEQTPQRMGG
jgi:heterodisulfide reductase subunit A-like polyferredoxin